MQEVNTHPAGRDPTQAWNVMGIRCPGALAAKGGVNLQPMPAQLPLGPETQTQLHACMYRKHLYTKPENAYMRPEGDGDSQDPSLVVAALESKGSRAFLEIHSI